jgi:hypothetical protein
MSKWQGALHFIATLFTIAKKWSQLKYLLRDDLIKKR